MGWAGRTFKGKVEKPKLDPKEIQRRRGIIEQRQARDNLVRDATRDELVRFLTGYTSGNLFDILKDRDSLSRLCRIPPDRLNLVLPEGNLGAVNEIIAKVHAAKSADKPRHGWGV